MSADLSGIAFRAIWGVMDKRFRISECEETDAERLLEGIDRVDFSVIPREQREEETLVFKVTAHDGRLAGGCVLSIDLWKNAEIERLWVEEDFRRQGFGTALVHAAERAAKAKGCHGIAATYVFDYQTAKQLFEACGYALCGIVKDWPRGHENYTFLKILDRIPEEQIPSERLRIPGFRLESGSEEDGEILLDALEAYNAAHAPRSHPYRDLDRKLTDGAGHMIAGCIAGVSGWDALHIDILWVDEPYRGQGIGTYLMENVENEARKLGAHIALLGAGDWEADFFRKNGYTAAVTQEGPGEHFWYTMQKRL